MNRSSLLFSTANSITMDAALFLLRLLTAGFMLTHGLEKLSNFSSLSEAFPDPLGVGHSASLIMILISEVGCSLLILLGLFTRLATLPSIFGMSIAFFVIHAGMPFAAKELAGIYLLLYIIILLMGPGRYSADYIIDKWLKKE
ncbi:DoxX family protein [Paludibacter sp.]|uniref:DoxX family protein n=1 Tax=Paludibacter sp. TaxID=1898105 RepID=UPI001352DAC7|nr:DoxX family protein [Paludibacter sp.]MTK54588.1 DoxX family protein [Paludibacter sp.]